MKSEDLLDPNNIPQHVAIIMDGNGRWAKQRGQARIFGHRSAFEAVRDTTETAARIGIKNLTLYAFSTENWNRPKIEVNALMELLVSTIGREIKTLNENNIRLLAIGDIESLPKKCIRELKKGMDATAANTRMNLILALSYSAKWEILKAVKNIASDVKKGHLTADEIDDRLFSSYLSTADLPDPELMVRTSGEQRISNFLLWQLAYAELYFVQKLWPDFRGTDLVEAVHDYQSRERRFGKTSEQLVK